MLSLFQVQLSGQWYLSEPLKQLSVALVFSVFHAGSSLRATPGSWVGPAGSFQGVVSADKPPVATCFFGTRLWDIQLRRTRSWDRAASHIFQKVDKTGNRIYGNEVTKRGRTGGLEATQVKRREDQAECSQLGKPWLSISALPFFLLLPFFQVFIKLLLLIIPNSKFPGHSIKCWVCRSDGDPKCADPFDNRQPPLILQS